VPYSSSSPWITSVGHFTEGRTGSSDQLSEGGAQPGIDPRAQYPRGFFAVITG
jgi:hypothetical protein